MVLICIIDDDPVVSHSIGAMLESNGYEVATFDSGEAFLMYDQIDRASCALVDLRMPGLDGIALLDRLTARGVRLPVVIMTGQADVPAAVAAMKAGAIDFIEKPCIAAEILALVARASDLAQPQEKRDLADPQAIARLGTLTPRERDLLRYLVIGHSNKAIAFELQISPRTVEIHRAHLMQ
jgi:two-component system response regulator FixJ